jgi:hypothetical protein
MAAQTYFLGLRFRLREFFLLFLLRFVKVVCAAPRSHAGAPTTRRPSPGPRGTPAQPGRTASASAGKRSSEAPKQPTITASGPQPKEQVKPTIEYSGGTRPRTAQSPAPADAGREAPPLSTDPGRRSCICAESAPRPLRSRHPRPLKSPAPHSLRRARCDNLTGPQASAPALPGITQRNSALL